jgi:hypothetical protein
VLEPRHASWFAPDVDDWLAQRRIAASPPIGANCRRWRARRLEQASVLSLARLAANLLFGLWRCGIGCAKAAPCGQPRARICGVVHLRQYSFGRGAWKRIKASTATGRETTESKIPMSERLETLKKARERMTDDRDAFAKVLAAPFDRDKAERARVKFIETQVLIDAIDRAIDGEQGRPAAA